MHALTSDGAGLGGATSRKDAEHRLDAVGVPCLVVVKLQPRDRAGPDDALVGRGGRRDAVNLGDGRRESRLVEVEHRNAVDVEVVVAKVLDGGQAFEPKFGSFGEGVQRVGAVLSASKLVERERLVPEQVGRGTIPELLADAAFSCPGVEARDVVEDGNGAIRGGIARCLGAGVVLNTVAEGDLLKDEVGRRRNKLLACSIVSLRP